MIGSGNAVGKDSTTATTTSTGGQVGVGIMGTTSTTGGQVGVGFVGSDDTSVDGGQVGVGR